MQVFVVYDIVDDKLRTKIADICLDYGLKRVQYSTFMGELSTNRRQELVLKLRSRFKTAEGCVYVLALCERDAALVVKMGKTLIER
ncbi:MAG TPA: CRISPR-associated endonuclease Cas2 [Chthonomonas sp.]|uniref:CRISPR-associated endonuclease Cas2 n=1 Tax=Chthonomonas sp. TaxID=2282153 RepID=UPI002B4B03C8|nr:CRISPR-associated endonuclease Cas2 [Chthonomonas sp.]HLI47388.1 CRISPR-associated endonuclease Cas2 [Chthonomonas sp.]